MSSWNFRQSGADQSKLSRQSFAFSWRPRWQAADRCCLELATVYKKRQRRVQATHRVVDANAQEKGDRWAVCQLLNTIPATGECRPGIRADMRLSHALVSLTPPQAP